MTLTTKQPETTAPEPPFEEDEPSVLAEQGRLWGLRAVLFVVFFGVWEAIVASNVVREVVLPRPTDVLANFVSTVTSTDILRHLWITVQETL